MARHKEKRRFRRYKKPRQAPIFAEPPDPKVYRQIIVGSVDKEKWHEEQWHDSLLLPIVAFFVWAGIAAAAMYMLYKMIFKGILE